MKWARYWNRSDLQSEEMPLRVGLRLKKWQAQSFACWTLECWMQSFPYRKTFCCYSWSQESLHLSSETACSEYSRPLTYLSKKAELPSCICSSILSLFHCTSWFCLDIFIFASYIDFLFHFNNNAFANYNRLTKLLFLNIKTNPKIPLSPLKCLRLKIWLKPKSSKKKCLKNISTLMTINR